MVKISICGMCKHYWGLTEAKHESCPAYPQGVPLHFFATTDTDCGNGVRFEPKNEFLSICNEDFYKEFSSNPPDFGDAEIVVGTPLY
jgi:hypothetical protein